MAEDSRDVLRAQVRKLKANTDALKNSMPPHVEQVAHRLSSLSLNLEDTSPSEAPSLAASPAPKAVKEKPPINTNIRKKKALIDELIQEWPSIEKQISEAPRNGLNEAAHTEKHGYWDIEKARAWAKTNGYLKKPSATASQLNTLLFKPTTKR